MSPTSTPAAALGIDVGGANLKWALAEKGAGSGGGALLHSGVIPFPLWQQPGALPSRLREAGRRAARAAREEGGAAAGEADIAGRPAPPGYDDASPGGEAASPGPDDEVPAPGVTALSLTAELADCYRDRAEGVRRIVGAARRVWRDDRLRVFCRDGAWRSAAEVESSPRAAAAANWRAPAEWLARRGREVLLADMGSTTTDLVPVRDGEAGTGAVTDLERLRGGELVYTGLLRTPVAAMLREVELPGGAVPVAAERFAVAADVHLWLGSLSPAEYRCETPDGGPATREAAGRRLARMVCAGPNELGPEGIDAVARAAADAQAGDVVDAIGRQRRRAGRVPRQGLATGAGAGVLAAHLRRAGLELADPPDPLAGGHAPAATATTLALLALESGR